MFDDYASDADIDTIHEKPSKVYPVVNYDLYIISNLGTPSSCIIRATIDLVIHNWAI